MTVENGVEQARLSRVRRTEQHGPHGMAGELTSLPRFQELPDLVVERRKPRHDLAARDDLDVLIREIERDLHQRRKIGEALAKVGNPAAQVARKHGRRGAELRFAPCTNEGLHCLRLGQIETAVHEGAPCEFARTGRPRAGARERGENGAQQGGIAEGVDLHDVLARVRGGRAHDVNASREAHAVERDLQREGPIVSARRRCSTAEGGCAAMGREAPEQLDRLRPAQPHDAPRRPPGRGGHRHDRIARKDRHCQTAP